MSSGQKILIIFLLTVQQGLHSFSFKDFTKKAEDFLHINTNLFHKDSLIILGSSTIFYCAARGYDEEFQNHFYDGRYHKNINQIPDALNKAADAVLLYLVFGLTFKKIFSREYEERQTGWMGILGLLATMLAKVVLKEIKVYESLRPWHEKYSSKKRASGGFPSGHMSKASFFTTFYALRYGPLYGVPLAFFTAGMFAISVNHNRHYLSQAVAGTALGFLYGFAADKTLTNRLSKNLTFNIDIQNSGRVEGSVTWRF